MKNKKCHNIGTIRKSNRKLDTPQIHDHLLFWVNGRVKVAVLSQTSILSEMMRSCKCFPHVSKMPALIYNLGMIESNLVLPTHRIGSIMVSMLASSVVDRGFEPRSTQTKDYNIGICWFSAKHAALRRKNKDWSARNQNNVSEWSDMSTRGLLFQWASTINKNN
jgi:hypothetical protein